ncbi:phosphonate ABC transporter ATP-binding protein [Natronomonas sp. EA1]|uniref:phosphonate ABC transporter ATP-binding protein n=1 Tax=Natronomonas sp. EA1 TaxID=3421655 RepID=UPI003EB77BB2
MPRISVEDLSKHYGDTVALDDVSFTIPEGEFVVLLGPSGAGKSTLLRLLNGLATPTEGSIYIGDEQVTGKRSDIGMVFQMHYLVETMSAYRNALTGALSRTGFLESVTTSYDESDKLAALEALDTVGLLNEARQRAGSMSGGQQQRVGIARALVQNPALLLADEPVASLDPKAAEEVMRYMKSAAAERDLTTIASLHQVSLAREFGERYIGLRDGRVVFDGTRDDLTMDIVDDIYYDDAEEELGGVLA